MSIKFSLSEKSSFVNTFDPPTAQHILKHFKRSTLSRRNNEGGPYSTTLETADFVLGQDPSALLQQKSERHAYLREEMLWFGEAGGPASSSSFFPETRKEGQSAFHLLRSPRPKNTGEQDLAQLQCFGLTYY